MVRPTFVMLIGLPGSGKSTLAKEYVKKYGASIHSSDSIRQELSGDVENQNINSEVFKLLHKRVREDLISGKSTIYDATNISWKRRKAFLDNIKKIDCVKTAILVATPFEVCVSQNEQRDRVVPYDVIEKMYKSIDVPYYNEGWDNIHIEYPNSNYAKLYGHWSEFIYSTLDFEQENSHHKLTLGEHCLKCKEYVRNRLKDMGEKFVNKIGDELIIASSIHDCGKPFTKTFENKKGISSEEAHYYEHEIVGSYNSLFYDMEEDVDKLDVAALIRWHMILHFSNNWKDKTKDKYTKEFTKNEYLSSIEFYEALNILYEGDRNAH